MGARILGLLIQMNFDDFFTKFGPPFIFLVLPLSSCCVHGGEEDTGELNKKIIVYCLVGDQLSISIDQVISKGVLLLYLYFFFLCHYRFGQRRFRAISRAWRLVWG